MNVESIDIFHLRLMTYSAASQSGVIGMIWLHLYIKTMDQANVLNAFPPTEHITKEE